MISELMCRIGLRRWITQHNPENGVAYLECERCHKQKDTMSISDFSRPQLISFPPIGPARPRRGPIAPRGRA